MKITLVKKILEDGSPCKKCGEVIERLEASGDIAKIDDILVADVRDPYSDGMQLAAKLDVERAPFFVIEEDGKEPVVYTIFMKFVKEVLDKKTSATEELTEIMANNDDLDFL